MIRIVLYYTTQRSRTGLNFLFQSKLSKKPKIVRKYPTLYQKILRKWENFLCSSLNILATIASQIDNSTAFNI